MTMEASTDRAPRGWGHHARRAGGPSGPPAPIRRPSWQRRAASAAWGRAASSTGQVVLDRLDAVAAITGAAIDIVTADAGYAYAKVFAGLEDREIDAVIPAKAEQRPGKTIPTRRFRFDARHNLAHCPRGKTLRPKGKPYRGFQYFHARAKD